MSDAILEYSHAMDWSESQVDSMKAWLSTTWVGMDEDEPDQDFLEYIMVMIKTQKKMNELQSELKDLGVDEAKARDFAVSIGGKLQELASSSPKEKKIDSKVISVVADPNQDKKIMGALKSSRGPSGGSNNGNATEKTNNSGSSRILQSALSSSRTGASNSANPQQQQRQGQNSGVNNSNNDRNGSSRHVENRGQGQKRGQDSYGDRQDRDGFKRQSNNGNNGNSNFNNNQSSNSFQRVVSAPPPPPPAAAKGSAQVGTVEYFEQMNQVAQASGFKNAQEMLASQKEMMSLMQGQGASAGPPVGFVPPVPAYPGQFQQQFAQPPYPGGAPPPQGQPFGFGGRGYGRGGGRWEGSFSGRGGREGGRGRGRGGRGGEAPAASAESETLVAEGATEVSSGTTNATSTLPAAYTEDTGAIAGAGVYAGRGEGGRGGRGRGYLGQNWQPQPFAGYPAAPYTGRGYQGRGYQGRGGRGYQGGEAGAEGAEQGAATGHKVWVRKPDLETALVSGR